MTTPTANTWNSPTTTSPAARLRTMAAAAMIGTDRAGGAGPGDLLSHAAMVGAQARAGWKPRVSREEPARCPHDSSPIAGVSAMATLVRLLSEPDAALIEEWAELASARGVRVADVTVPSVLDWWSRQPSRSAVVFAALGKRGEWLASLNSAWRKPVAGADIPANADELWQTSSSSERVALLKTVRKHDPARAQALVQGTWQNDGADDRKRFVEALAERRSLEDEPFLESALDDKSKVVRRQAAALLGLIGGSRLKARMNDRARAMIKVEAKRGLLKRGSRITLTPPETFDKAWERDGIEEQAASGKGKRAWWMRQVLSVADLSVWTEASGLDPEGVLKALGEDDYLQDARAAIVQAARDGGDAEWSGALADSLLEGKSVDMAELSGLAEGLADAAREALLLEIAGHQRFGAADRWLLLSISDRRWTPSFSSKAIRLLGRDLPKRKDQAMYLTLEIERVSRVVAPVAAQAFEDAVMALVPEDAPERFRKSIDRVRLRSDMHKEFAS